MGTIAKVVASGEPIYGGKLSFLLVLGAPSVGCSLWYRERDVTRKCAAGRWGTYDAGAARLKGRSTINPDMRPVLHYLRIPKEAELDKN